MPSTVLRISNNSNKVLEDCHILDKESEAKRVFYNLPKSMELVDNRIEPQTIHTNQYSL